MASLISSRALLSSSAVASTSSAAGPDSTLSYLSLHRRHSVALRQIRPAAAAASQSINLSARRLRYTNLTPKCFRTNFVVDVEHVVRPADGIRKDLPSDRSISYLSLTKSVDILDSKSLKLTSEEEQDHLSNSLFTELTVLSEEEQDTLAATPAHRGGLYALYGSYLAGNLVERVWNFAWPAAVAMLHPSLLPVAVVGFFTKLAMFIGGPLLGEFMDHFPRIRAYYGLNLVQISSQLVSAAMIIYALANGTAQYTTATSVLVQPWFMVLVVAGAMERLSGVALGVTMERDWVVRLAGANRPVALAKANAMLNRIDQFSEIAGATIFGILLSKYDTATCLKFASGLMMCTLPVVAILGQLVNRLSSGVLDDINKPAAPSVSEKLVAGTQPGRRVINPGNIVKKGFKTIKHGWMEYKEQPVLPASVASVFLYFNIALAPGSIMTAFLMHHGISPSIVGGFSGLCAFMGVAATFISATLVKKLGILKAGAAGLVFQASVLTMALGVLCCTRTAQQAPLYLFLSLIVLSRLGHMSYDLVGTQILQTGIPLSKANLIGTTEISIASLAEFIMLGVAIIANDVAHFGFLAMLSTSCVVGAAWMFCHWLSNPTDQQKKLFSFDGSSHHSTQ
ncbi:solute carrier family 40 member 2, chloroplastic [Iris pallida]|uniref:Solute carrier family 40 member n=1 Tax=Iris pallida TaxID=29817 RepID=A0AAX6DWS2_IRIPA|nr:solute carrier family 40 member 2, chloroplastic [Iris pallida]KAJ6796252.1 solute carrier family 40 member 2, chloroplastic [Iris pallida]